jgi:hypothetical protein
MIEPENEQIQYQTRFSGNQDIEGEVNSSDLSL